MTNRTTPGGTLAGVERGLVLSLFPGIGLLDRAFEELGFMVVRGPDPVWGGDIRSFHVPPARFEGVIGGPPCQSFSGFANLQRAQGREPKFGNMIPEFERLVSEADPHWFLMENVPTAPAPHPRKGIEPYPTVERVINNRWLGQEQNRVRRFTFGANPWRAATIDVDRFHIEGAALENPAWAAAVTAAHGGDRKTHALKKTGGKITRYSLPRALELQGLPADFLKHCPFTQQGALQAIANGVPLPMGRAVARAVINASAFERARESA